MAGVEGARGVRYLQISTDLASVNTHSCWGPVPFVNLPALDPHPRPRSRALGPLSPSPRFAHRRAGPESASGGVRGCARGTSPQAAAACPALGPEPGKVPFFKATTASPSPARARGSTPPALHPPPPGGVVREERKVSEALSCLPPGWLDWFCFVRVKPKKKTQCPRTKE